MTAAYILIYDDESKDINFIRSQMSSLAALSGETIDRWVIECGDAKTHSFNKAIFDGLEGGSLYVEDILRLGNTLNDIISVLCMALRRNVRIYGTFDGYSPDAIGDTPSYIRTLERVAAVNRRLKSSRTKAAMERKRNQGCTLGRPKGTDAKMKLLILNEDIIKKELDSGTAQADLCTRFNVSTSTFRRYCKMAGI